MTVESKLQRRYEDHSECLVCERRCKIREGMRGACGNYVNVSGSLYHIGYGKLSHVESRPIEIKPLFHYWPNSTALTYSNYGCNFYCPWCQNHEISFRWPPEVPRVPPSYLIELAKRRGDHGISASLNEPATNFDFVLEASELAKASGLYSMVVTNGYFTLEALRELLNAGTDGYSIDIKGCPEMAERKILPHVNHDVIFRNAREIIGEGGHVEMVYLVVTRANDPESCFNWIIDRHLSSLGPDVPLHINRYFPANRWKEPETDLRKLFHFRERAMKEGINFVYVGNVWDPDLESTFCPKCGKLLIYRRMSRVTHFSLTQEGEKWKCPRCGKVIPMKGRFIQQRKSAFL